MRTLLLTLAFVLTQLSLTARQLPNVERFAEYRNVVLQRGDEGQKVNATLSSLFKIAADTRIREDAEIVRFPEGRKQRLRLAFSMTSEDVLLVESKSSANGTVVSVFHTEIRSLSLLAAASGPTTNDLQLIPNDRAESDFRAILMTWDRVVPNILLRERHKSP